MRGLANICGITKIRIKQNQELNAQVTLIKLNQ